jgi:hypothetical protein
LNGNGKIIKMVEGQRWWEKEGGERGGGECLTWWIVTTDDFGGGRAEGPWRCNLTTILRGYVQD